MMGLYLELRHSCVVSTLWQRQMCIRDSSEPVSQVLRGVDVGWLLCAARRWSFAAVSWAVGLFRGVDEREADECRVDPRVRKWSLRVTEARGGSPWVAFIAWDDDTLTFCLQAIVEQE